jgi:hypothetical protein
MSRVIEPGPASAYSVQDPHGRLPGTWLPSVSTCILLGAGLRLLGRSHEFERLLTGWTPWAIALVVAAVVARLTSPDRRRRRLLATHPWIEYDGAVKLTEPTPDGDVLVTITEDSGTRRAWQTRPSDRDFNEGEQSIWIAGAPAETYVMISLRRGECTGLGNAGLPRMTMKL